MHLSQGEHERKKFPHPFCANPTEEAILTRQLEETGELPEIPWMISIQPSKLRQAIDEVEKLGRWLDQKLKGGPKRLPTEIAGCNSQEPLKGRQETAAKGERWPYR